MRYLLRVSFVTLGSISILTSMSCTRADLDTENPTASDTTMHEAAYLGQRPPGEVPLRFGSAPFLANENWFYHSSPGFAPDGMTAVWTKSGSIGGLETLLSRYVDGSWTEPSTPTFAQGPDENQPRYSVDGESIYFMSHRGSQRIMRTTWTGTQWTDPIPLDIDLPAGASLGLQFCFVADGSLYVDANPSHNEPDDIYRVERQENGFEEAVRLPEPVNSEYFDFAPYVPLDESYIVFASNRPGGFGAMDLWIAFRNPDGTWATPVNMGSDVNTPADEAMPFVTLDGRFLFFISQRDGDPGFNPYWVSTQYLQELRH